ncbi:translation protein SH3-like domain-containing protein [Lipomyces arxii]|uniref:mitochondrial 54S ribosomal protein bL19m n=1 Tax=Lipomyces arxii TaxID=56418 RepID=UPI0034CDBF63
MYSVTRSILSNVKSAVSELVRSRAHQSAAFQLPARHVKSKVGVKPLLKSLLPKGTHPIQLLETKYKETYDPTGWRRMLFDRSSPNRVRPGDVIKVLYEAQTNQVFQGTIMAIRRRGLDTSVRIRAEIAQVGVEMSVKVFGTSIRNIEFVSRGIRRARRAKLYYLRPDEAKGRKRK